MPSQDLIKPDTAVDRRQHFRRLVIEHRQKIFQLAYNLTGSTVDAEDLSQEVFLKAYKAMDRFRQESAVYTWLYRITLTTFIDMKRKRSDRARGLTEELDETRLAQAADGEMLASRVERPEQVYRNQKLGQRIDQAMDTLSVRERSVFVLKHQSDLRIDEIAELMAVSPGTVKSFLFRATQKLRRRLIGEHGIRCAASGDVS